MFLLNTNKGILERSIKYKNINLYSYNNGKEARKGIGEWVEFYNKIRPYSSLGGASPNDFYEKQIKVARKKQHD